MLVDYGAGRLLSKAEFVTYSMKICLGDKDDMGLAIRKQRVLRLLLELDTYHFILDSPDALKALETWKHYDQIMLDPKSPALHIRHAAECVYSPNLTLDVQSREQL
ncbi:hypothetical protein PGQ11_008810 [Apiospora arundinis]|uniref:Uncharacterized protein n=1 Tax=Apiospora arundinis TaxID=335852 RepID=A0ABR2IGS3_9PEZI